LSHVSDIKLVNLTGCEILICGREDSPMPISDMYMTGLIDASITIKFARADSDMSITNVHEPSCAFLPSITFTNVSTLGDCEIKLAGNLDIVDCPAVGPNQPGLDGLSVAQAENVTISNCGSGGDIKIEQVAHVSLIDFDGNDDMLQIFSVGSLEIVRGQNLNLHAAGVSHGAVITDSTFDELSLKGTDGVWITGSTIPLLSLAECTGAVTVSHNIVKFLSCETIVGDVRICGNSGPMEDQFLALSLQLRLVSGDAVVDGNRALQYTFVNNKNLILAGNVGDAICDLGNAGNTACGFADNLTSQIGTCFALEPLRTCGVTNLTQCPGKLP